MTGVSGAQTCPACGSGAISSQRRTRDPVTGESMTQALMGVVVWGLLALVGVLVPLLLAIELIGPHPSNVRFGFLDLFIVGCCVFAIVNFWVQLRRFRGRGPVAGHVYWCRDCANEWFVPDNRGWFTRLPTWGQVLFFFFYPIAIPYGIWATLKKGGRFSQLPAWAKVLFVLFYPVSITYGVWAMWRDRRFSLGVRIALSVVLVAFFAFLIFRAATAP